MFLRSLDVTGLFTWYALVVPPLVAATALLRYLVNAGRPNRAPLSTFELAYLSGGADLACRAGLAWLHRAGLIETGPLATLRSVGRAPQSPPPLTSALYSALRGGQTWSQVRRDHEVRRELHRTGQRMIRYGYLLSPAGRRAIALATVPLFLVAAVAAVLLAVALADDTPSRPAPTVGLLLSVTATVLAGWLLAQPPATTRAARRALRKARERFGGSRDWSTVPAAELSRAVALRGPRGPLATDPVFAAALQIEDVQPAPFGKDVPSTASSRSGDTGPVDARG
ncbi:TIGR04222 domain-containing membrane protein [Micromonospora echinofusca]|uniref:TIGR04222 domain-containing membrane protein n=1 Tax=Micromonospora echinofusca TaxID=47858 RepID=A0ABS3VSJ3_MICEH|nr:TIGR04222 domain-containing membrane protein [Micromonospora echinofusca]MBO4207500.1 TIGR04222 domain-containing membrane protein [Micromonospora echinofusca]